MKAQRGMYIIGIVIFSLMLVGAALFSAQASNQPELKPPTLSDALSLIPGPSDWIVVRLYFNDRDHLNQVAGQLDIWEVNKKENYAVVALPPEQYHWLEVLGYRMEIDPEKTALLNKPVEMLPRQVTGIPGYPCYRTVEETYANLANLAMLNPMLTSWIDIGNSWDKITPGGPTGYDIFSLVLTNKNIPGPKPTFFLMAEIHAREYTTAELAARFAEFLVANHGIDPDVTWLLDYFEVHIVPMTNPDGRKIAESGILWRKNTDNDDFCSDPSRWGTDLNRNHSFKWGCCGGSSGNSCSEIYRGPSAISEPETWAIQNYVLNLFPDQRGPGDSDPAPDDATGVFITLHSFSELVLWPWGWTSTDAPNHSQLRTLGRKFAYFNSYNPQQSHELYVTDGTTDDWSYGELGIAAYTFELGTWFFESCYQFENTIYPDNMPALLTAFKAARRPYMNPAGPDALDVTLNSQSVTPGDAVTLTATVDDTRFYSGPYPPEPTQDIQAARYSIDDPSWITGTLIYPLTAADGSFDDPVENVFTIIDTTGLSIGRHTIFVEGQDDIGNWGSPSAVFLFIEPEVSPTAEFTSNSPVELGDPMFFTNLSAGIQPITYHWDFGDNSGTSTKIHPAYTYLQTGEYTVTLVATNTFGTDAVSHTVTVSPQICTQIDIVDLTQITTGTIYLGDTVDFSANLSPDNADKPYTYTVDYGDGVPPITESSADDPLAISHTFSVTGTFHVDIGAWNCSMVELVTDTLTLNVYEPGVCVDISAITIIGPTGGTPGIYTFTTIYAPVDATPPFSYLWDNGDNTRNSVRTLDIGEHTLTVTATNCTDALVTDTFKITISPHKYFLPIVNKDDGVVTDQEYILPVSMMLALPPLLAIVLLSTRKVRLRN